MLHYYSVLQHIETASQYYDCCYFLRKKTVNSFCWPQRKLFKVRNLEIISVSNFQFMIILQLVSTSNSKKRPAQRDKYIWLSSQTQQQMGNNLLSPAKDGLVCSRHFIHKRLTEDNLYPAEELGYTKLHENVYGYTYKSERGFLLATAWFRYKCENVLYTKHAQISIQVIVHPCQVVHWISFSFCLALGFTFQFVYKCNPINPL